MPFNGDSKTLFEGGPSPRSRDVDPNIKRPGITEIVRRLQHENPDWSLERCTARAKTIWREENPQC